ncbi:hypothetical protein F3Y22_tig00110677pilonHSYRG00012 [Hibiscus syriacus]|uniref:RNase H type-1 domain-containing protein n=1 Tax=Hibiscus syriacus TaxID=106335 RepID=A0A6A2ZX94_HIBSY|nr:hypothetical protein F3Y22_tig00110677pilonHSYRG00012 [Hibiscus syriacus]
MSEVLPTHIETRNCPFVWKSLARVWGFIRDNVCWSIGDGRGTLFWDDNWIQGTQLLAKVTDPACPINPFAVVRDYNKDNGEWDTSLLSLHLDEDTVKHITAIIPLSDDMGLDSEAYDWRHIFGVLLWSYGNYNIQRWKPPIAGTFKLNTVGAVDPRTMDAMGGVLRDSNGQWVIGFHRNIGRCSIFHAELWALLDGLTLAWDQGMRDMRWNSITRMLWRRLTILHIYARFQSFEGYAS